MTKKKIPQNHYESKYLENEHPILIKPLIAAALNSDRQAYFIQQVKYWMNKNAAKGRNDYDGLQWMFNTLEDWHAEFPWLSVMTIRRIVDALKEKEILITGNYNKKKYDKTTWYSIDERKLDEVIEQYKSECSKRTKASVQNEHMEENKKNKPIPETSSETIKESDTHSNLTVKEKNQIIEKLIQHYTDLFTKANGISPVITKANRQQVAALVDKHSADLLLAAVEIHVNEPDRWTQERGCLLATLEHNLPGYMLKLNQRAAEDEQQRKNRERQAQLQEEERLLDEQLARERAEWEALPEEEKQRITAARQKVIDDLKKGSNKG